MANANGLLRKYAIHINKLGVHNICHVRLNINITYSFQRDILQTLSPQGSVSVFHHGHNDIIVLCAKFFKGGFRAVQLFILCRKYLSCLRYLEKCECTDSCEYHLRELSTVASATITAPSTSVSVFEFFILYHSFLHTKNAYA